METFEFKSINANWKLWNYKQIFSGKDKNIYKNC